MLFSEKEAAEIVKLYSTIFIFEQHYKESTDACTRRSWAASLLKAIQTYRDRVSVQVKEIVGGDHNLNELEQMCNATIEAFDKEQKAQTPQ